MITCLGGCGRDFLSQIAKKWGLDPCGKEVCDQCRAAAWEKKFKEYMAGGPIKVAGK